MSKMTSGVASAPLSQVDTPLLAVALAQGSVVPASLADLDRAAGGVVARAITSGDFKGKRDETTLLYPGAAKSQRDLLSRAPDRVAGESAGLPHADERDAAPPGGARVEPGRAVGHTRGRRARDGRPPPRAHR